MNGSPESVDPVAKPAHDLLCACYPNLTGAPCRCDLIAEVRADEREQAAQRVVDLYLASHDMYSRPPVCAEVLDTIREVQP